MTEDGHSVELVRFLNPRQYCGVIGSFQADRISEVIVRPDVRIRHLWVRFEPPPVEKKVEKVDGLLVIQEFRSDQDGSYRFEIRAVKVRDKSQQYIEIGPGSSRLLPARYLPD